MSKRLWQTTIVIVGAMIACVAVVRMNAAPPARNPQARTPQGRNAPIRNAPAAPESNASTAPIDGKRAWGYLDKLCALGPRISGTPQMKKQQDLIGAHFQQQGAKVRLQRFRVRHPVTGKPVEMGNLIAQWNPEAKERLLLCAHYDTRPYPDRDPKNPRGVFLGANDGASGAALLMELANHLSQYEGPYGIDLVLFDGEELVYREKDPYFYGSEFFARDYAANPPGFKYRWGVLLDMVGDADLELLYEANSYNWPETRPLTESIWQTARKAGVREFIPQIGSEVRDDHVPLRTYGGIAACDLIDFDYPYWHTTQDTPDKCSGESLAKVGGVIWQWLKQVP